jgi:hypothetical protein
VYKSWFLQIMQENASVGCSCRSRDSVPSSGSPAASYSGEESECELSMSERRRGRSLHVPDSATGHLSRRRGSWRWRTSSWEWGGVFNWWDGHKHKHGRLATKTANDGRVDS